MGTLFLLLFCMLIVVFARVRRSRRSHPTPASSAHIEIDTAPSWSPPDTGPVAPLGQTVGWFLNPTSDYPMTVFGITQAKAEELRGRNTVSATVFGLKHGPPPPHARASDVSVSH